MVYRFYKIERFFFNIKLTPLAILVRIFMRIVFSCDIPYKLKMGKNISFPHHALGVVIHQDAVIGDNCKILHGVTIGGKAGHKELPQVGDNVLIGANSIIIGPIKIGNNVTIGAGSVVLKDIPNNSVVAGVPAKIIKK